MSQQALSTQHSVVSTTNAYDVLVERGYVKDVSDVDGLREALARPLTFYVGFDPTAASLHVGNLVPVMAMAQLQRHGHRPIVLLGGGTTLVGDPSGKTATRTVPTPEQIQANLPAIREQLTRFFAFEPGGRDTASPPARNRTTTAVERSGAERAGATRNTSSVAGLGG